MLLQYVLCQAPSGAPKPRELRLQRIKALCQAIILASGLACISLLALPQAAHADWPERTIKLVVIFPLGSANDAAARIFADAPSRQWGRPVLIDNKAGAEGMIGAAASSLRSDHTLLYTVAGTLSVAPLLVDKLPYDTDLDLVPIAARPAIVLALALNGQLTARTMDFFHFATVLGIKAVTFR